MSWATESLNLCYGKVLVRSLCSTDLDRVAEAIHDPEGWSGRKWDINTPEKIRALLKAQLESHSRGECHPFVYLVEDEVAGISRYHSIVPQRKGLEIGGTCVAPKWRRTFVNTEVKNLLLTHAFEKLGAVRVELRVDCSNYVSQMNVLRLGATFEGKIRHWQVRKDGEIPDGMLYSITSKEWPCVKERLKLLRDRKPPPTPFLPHELESSRFRMRLHRLSDATDLLALAQRNQESLIESFPQAASLKRLEDAQAYIAERAHWASSGTAFYYGVRDQKSHQLVGQFHVRNINWKLGSAELGYFVDTNHRRTGICSEVAKIILQELFERKGFRRITIRTVTSNKPSLQLALKLRFTQEGILRSEFLNRYGKDVDIALFSRHLSDGPIL